MYSHTNYIHLRFRNITEREERGWWCNLFLFYIDIHKNGYIEQSIKYNSLNKALIYSMKGENIYG